MGFDGHFRTEIGLQMLFSYIELKLVKFPKMIR